MERMGFGFCLFIGWATPLPIITGPEALRPTLSRSLPFSQLCFYIIYRNILFYAQKNVKFIIRFKG
jgi:hypothetical protein